MNIESVRNVIKLWFIYWNEWIIDVLFVIMYCGYVVLRSLLKFDKIVLHMVLQLWKLSEICQLDMLQHNNLSTKKAKGNIKAL